jgi:4-amino-4-deoxy-L-arabinose transferase-like glycosyltransferase
MGKSVRRMSKDDTCNMDYMNTKSTKKWAVLLMFILLIFLILKWPSHNTLPIWDESVYIGMGKYLYSSGESGLWESIRPIGLPLLTGFFWKIGGMEWQLYLSKIFSLLFAVGTIFLTYIIARKIYGRTSGIIAAALLALSAVFFHHAGLILTDIISTFFMLLAVYFYISFKSQLGKNKTSPKRADSNRNALIFFLIGLTSATALLFRFPHGILIIFFSVLILLDIKYKNARFNDLVFFLLGLTIILPFLIFNYSMYAQYTANAFDAIFRPFILGSIHQGNIYQSVQGFWNNISYYIIALLLINPLLFLAFFSIRKAIDKRSIKNARNKTMYNESHKMTCDVILKLYVLMCAYLIYLTYIANKQERFLLMILPIVIILSSGVIIHYISDNKSVWKHLRYSIMATLLVIFILFNIQSMARPYYYNGSQAYDSSIALYKYYNNNNATTILTTDPVFAVYSDNLFVPFYDMVGHDVIKSIYVNDWESDYEFDAAVYTPSSFPCIDIMCEANHEELYNYFSSKCSLEKKIVVLNREYYFFNKKFNKK